MRSVTTGLEADLRTIWDKYEPQRSAETVAHQTRETAFRELAELNAKRLTQGLPHVGEFSAQQGMGALQAAQSQWGVQQAAKTWRDEMSAELLTAVRRHFT